MASPSSPDQTLSATISKLSIQTFHPQPQPQPQPQPSTSSITIMNPAASTTPDSSPPTQTTHYTITNPLTFTRWLDSTPPENPSAITHLTLAPSPHLGRISSLPRLNDTLGDSLGDASTFAELHSWVTLLQRLSHHPSTSTLRSLTIIFAADTSGRDTHGYRRGVGECLGFIWAIGRFRGLQWVDLQGFFPAQWPWYLRSVWAAQGTMIYNRVEAPEWELREWRRGTERLDPRGFGWE
ncbi:hypothetical protein BCIN_11g02880 [Botrytis cinerea B05.10]|uniref:Uncharacterized protein n=1 Tax=Botryotinia fuckeliana (strain B05.10) TaxID=332648 RepID=A0A384JWJ5_BOTFB|nr:hypothetical protein BCIN_11g02880 [Botrytis cinerea B05.10]ATZ54976.1 hypothetical protein BCIN_11g02880 [Botrytis cinerea B05.10]